jgi:hypothetical protein
VRFGYDPMGIAAIQWANGKSRRHRAEIDERKQTLTLTQRSSPEPQVLTFVKQEDGSIKVEGSFEGANISARLVRDTEYKPLLTTRGFHWINEYPLNR